VIREAVAADRQALEACIAELQEHLRGVDPDLLPGAAMAPAYLDALLASAARDRGKVFVYERDAAVVGFVAVVVRSGENVLESTITENAHVVDLAVRREHHQTGVGAALLRAAERHAAGCGVKYVAIDVMAGNALARNTYARLGYEDYLVVVRKPLGSPERGRPCSAS
jgi:ribosomal protein S18 acetylase RimI-like enzyme